jgi:competence protein ComEC
MWLKLALAVSIAAWLAGAPLTLYHFGRVSSWGWLNSILITPLVGLLMLAGFLKLVVSAIWPSASVVVAAPVAWSTHALDASVRWLAAVPGVNVHIASPPLWLAVF